MPYEALLFADSHLKRRVDEQFAMRQIADLAKRKKVKHVIGAGDILDKQSNRADTISYLFEFIYQLEEAGITFWYLKGNHDWDEVGWPEGHRGAKHLHKQTLEFESLTAYGLDYQPHGKLQEELAEIPRGCNLLVAHQTWGDWMGDIASPQGDFAQIPGHVTHVFSGDLHQVKMDKCKNADGRIMLCISPGATTMQKIDEPAEHFCMLLDTKGIFSKSGLKSRVLIDWDVMNHTEDVERFVAEIEAELATAQQTAAANDYPETMLLPYLRVTYSHKLVDVVRRVEKVVAGRALLNWKELPPEAKQPQKNKVLKQALGAAAAAVTPLTVLPTKVDKEEKPEVFDLASRMLSSNNFEDEFGRWWTEATMVETK
jgi:predicted phosphodiesterase